MTTTTFDGGIDLPLPQVPSEDATENATGESADNQRLPAPGYGDMIYKEPLDDDSGYQPVDPKTIEKADFQKRYTGMEEEGGLYYTGTSTDYLLTYLRLRNEDPNLDEGVKARNLEAAQSIQSAQMSRDPETGDVLVVLKIREGQNIKNYVLAGGLGDGDSVSDLRLVKGGRGLRTTGDQPMEGKMKCLDEDGGCETTFVRIKFGEHAKYRAAVAILFRESLADIRASLSASTGNPEYENIRKFWINSHNQANTDFRLKSATMKSFEIVNGRSGFEVQVKSKDRQLLSFRGPLLAPDAGTSVNITADRTTDMKESLDLDGLSDYKMDLANFIGSAKIVNNNGLGQVRLSLKMRKRVGYPQESFRLTFMRIIKPTVSANEDNLKLK